MASEFITHIALEYFSLDAVIEGLNAVIEGVTV